MKVNKKKSAAVLTALAVLGLISTPVWTDAKEVPNTGKNIQKDGELDEAYASLNALIRTHAELAVENKTTAAEAMQAPAAQTYEAAAIAEAPAGQHTVFNEDGFYAKQDTTTGHGTYNSLTKDGLWVGGQDDNTGFHVDNNGNVKTTGTIFTGTKDQYTDISDKMVGNNVSKDGHDYTATLDGQNGLTVSDYTGSTRNAYTRTDAKGVETTGYVKAGSVTINDGGKITGLTAGTEDTDAVNVKQLHDVSEIANKGFSVAIPQADGSVQEHTYKPGDKITFTSNNDNLLTNIADDGTIDVQLNDTLHVGSVQSKDGKSTLNLTDEGTSLGYVDGDNTHSIAVDKAGTKVNGHFQVSTGQGTTLDVTADTVTAGGVVLQNDAVTTDDIFIKTKSANSGKIEDRSFRNAGLVAGTVSNNTKYQEQGRNIAIGKDANILFTDKQVVDNEGHGPWNAVAIGDNNLIQDSPNAVVIGGGNGAPTSVVNSSNGIALGINTTIDESSQAVAVGANSIIKNAKNGVALGAGSVVTDADTVSVGHKATDSAGGTDTWGTDLRRRITNVKDGIDEYDAATVGQLNGYVAYAKKADGTVNKDLVKFDGGEKGTALQNVGDITMKVPFQDATNDYKVTYQDRSFQRAGLMPGAVVFDDNFKPDPSHKLVAGNVVAIGHNANSYNSSGSTVVGEFSNIGSSNWSTALGAGVTVTNSEQSVSIGNGSTLTNSTASVALGQNSKVWKSDWSQAIGLGANIYGDAKNSAKYTNNIALGTYSSVESSNGSVALGSFSKVNGQDNVVSVGSTSLKRKIINVDKGTEDNDAVNYAQLKEVTGNVTGLTTIVGDGKYTSKNYLADGDSLTAAASKLDVQVKANADEIDKLHGAGIIAGAREGNTGISIGSSTVKNVINGIAIGAGAITEKKDKSFDISNGIALGERTKVIDSDKGIGIGGGNTRVIDGDFSVAIGANAQVDKSRYSVALGASSDALEADGDFVVSLGWKTSQMPGPGGSGYITRTIKHMTAGTAEDDAATVGQTLGYKQTGTESFIYTNPNSQYYQDPTTLTRPTFDYGIVELKGGTDAAGKNTGTQIKNLAAGTEAMDAVNKGQLDAVTKGFSDAGITAGDASSDTSVAIGSGSLARQQASTAIGYETDAMENGVAIGTYSDASDGAVAIGGGDFSNHTVAGNDGAVAIGRKAYNGAKHAVAIGEDSHIWNSGAEEYADTTSTYGVAIGGRSFVKGNDSVAIGGNSQIGSVGTQVNGATAVGGKTVVTGANSVALGFQSTADEENVVSVGKAGTDGFTRRLINVTAGKDANDAVIVSQFNGANSSSFLKTVNQIDWSKINTDALNNLDWGKVQSLSTKAATLTNLANAKFSLLSTVQPTVLAAEETAPDQNRAPGNKNDGNTSGGSGTSSPVDGVQTSTDKISVDRNLDVAGNATVGKDLTVKGNSTFEGTATFKKGADMGGNKVTNVADGTVDKDSKDAINGSQLYTEQQARIDGDNALGTRIDGLSGQVHQLGGEIDSVGAISAALAGLHPLDYNAADSKYQLAAAFGGYDGSYALALGGFYNVNQDILLSGGVSTILKGERKTAGNVGVTFRVGAGNSAKDLGTPEDLKEANQQLAALKQDNKVLTGENRKLAEKVESQDQKIADLEAKFEELLKKVK